MVTPGANSKTLVQPEPTTEPANERSAGSPTHPPIASLEQVELERSWARMRLVCQVGLAVWLSFILFDMAYGTWVYPGAVGALLLLRMAPVVVFIPSIIVLRGKFNHSPRNLRVIEQMCFQSAAWSIATMALFTGGVFSHYHSGIALVLALRTAAVGEPWRKALMPVFSMAASYSVVILLGIIVIPAMKSQLSDPAALVLLALTCSNLFGLAAFAILGSHFLWHSRRQLFEYRSIGRYSLVRRIGRGGMGEVWAAWHRGLKREVALKMLTPDSGEEQSVARFEREVAATVSLSHPNTIRIFDHGVTDDGIWYYAMEMLQGKDLAALVEREGALPVERAVHLLTQAASSLAEAHDRGIHHRDIKPENIFITHDGRHLDFVKVLDFGIARGMDGEAENNTRLTKTGSTLGSPAYLSPEVAMGNRADARSDVYGLGALLYFMLTGQPLFQKENVMGFLFAHASQEPAPVEAVRGEPLPADVVALVSRALSKNPASRQQNAGELVAELEACTSFGKWRPAAISSSAPEAPQVEQVNQGRTSLKP